MSEAIEINRARRPLYSKLSGGKSEKISDALIAFEKASIPLAGLMDRWAEPYQERGIGVVNDDFVSMSLTPAFRESFEVAAPLMKDFRPLGSLHLARLTLGIFVAGILGRFEKAHSLAYAGIEALGTEHRLSCMVRHFLESVARAALLAPEYRQTARIKNFKSPELLSRSLVCLQILGLPWAAWMDRLATPLQCAGLPIIYQDVPPIPYLRPTPM